MAFAARTALKVKPSSRIFSEQILKRFTDPLDCLTAHLMLECAEVITGVKPANLISIGNRTQPCGRNLYQLWHTHKVEVAFRLADLTFLVLQTKQRALLLFCYNHDQLERHLAHAGIRTMLRKAGYETDASIEVLLGELCRRIENSNSFPHEIGLFIGYPAKDVAAFMGIIKLPFACQRLWKIYGDPVQSLALAELYRCCRHRMGVVLASGKLKGPEPYNGQPFFCRSVDNEFHYSQGAIP